MIEESKYCSEVMRKDLNKEIVMTKFNLKNSSASLFLREVSSDTLHDFSVTIPKCYKDAHVNSFYPHTARLLNSLPIEHLSFTDDLNGFK